ncbi:MAG: flagellar basal body-associated FliL family protein [Kineosporiaceae bacterium]
MATKTADPAKEDAPAKGGKKKLIIIVAVVVLLAAGGGFFFLKSKGGGDAAEAEKKVEHVAGEVVTFDDGQTINLAGGHYLKLHFALQCDDKAEKELDGSKALDAAISVFSGMSIDELAKAEGREKAKKELVEKVSKLYEEHVYDIYFTEFVMQ